MLWALAAIEFVLWIYGLAAGHRMGGVIHSLFVLGTIAVLAELGLRLRHQWRANHPVVAEPAHIEEPEIDWSKAA